MAPPAEKAPATPLPPLLELTSLLATSATIPGTAAGTAVIATATRAGVATATLAGAVMTGVGPLVAEAGTAVMAARLGTVALEVRSIALW